MFSLGITDEGLAAFFDVALGTIKKWKAEYPEFMNSIKGAKDSPDDAVERALFQRATGYSHPEDKVFNQNGQAMIVPTTRHYPPDTAAAFIWLKNRRKEKWRDRHEVTGEDGGPLEIVYRVVNASRNED